MRVHLIKRSLKNGFRYYLHYSENGVFKREKTNILVVKNDTQAKEKKFKAEQLRLEKEHDLSRRISGVSSDLVYLKEYYQWYLNKCTLASIKKYQSTFNRLDNYFESDIVMSSLSHSDLQGFADSLYSELKIETVNSYLKCLKKVLNLAVSDNIIKESPASKLRLKQSNDNFIKPVILIDDVIKLWNIAHTPTQKAFIFACYTGVGLKEILSLNQSNISKNLFVYQRAKNGRNVSMKLKEGLRDLTNSKGLLFTDLPSDVTINKNLNKWIEKEQIKPTLDSKITFYCARHSFAVNLLLAGVDIRQVSLLLGHKDLTHTLRYLRFVDQLSGDSIDKLGGL